VFVVAGGLLGFDAYDSDREDGVDECMRTNTFRGHLLPFDPAVSVSAYLSDARFDACARFPPRRVRLARSAFLVLAQLMRAVGGDDDLLDALCARQIASRGLGENPPPLGGTRRV
jgi:hypothetical protein